MSIVYKLEIRRLVIFLPPKNEYTCAKFHLQKNNQFSLAPTRWSTNFTGYSLRNYSGGEREMVWMLG